ncbi:hypothetical protein [Halomicronema hongdechloris]|uniref:hypothetical protein n=1 Tax=Halomicronema hongdechloris TaxID=1209493 RepID=UPI0009B9D531|nr:hypothetical protein [Halomicronema hongdechloris]
MSSLPPSRLHLQLVIPPDAAPLLAGLTALLELQLIDHPQVRVICADYLTCRVSPPPQPEPDSAPAFLPAAPISATQVVAPVVSRRHRWQLILQRRWRQLRTELSVIWLLGLGVFLVVLSSAVLAATQWSRFTGVGQYLVLWGYTLAFWGASRVSDRPQLRLTHHTLAITTLLLVAPEYLGLGCPCHRTSGTRQTDGVLSRDITGRDDHTAIRSALAPGSRQFSNIFGVSPATGNVGLGARANRRLWRRCWGNPGGLATAATARPQLAGDRAGS